MAIEKAVYARLATRADVPVIKCLIEALAEFEKLTDQCYATEAALEATLFLQPPFVGTTVLILEIGSYLSEQQRLSSKEDECRVECNFQEKCEQVTFAAEVEDPKAATFQSPVHEDRIVAGFVLFFPNYSTFLAKPGIYIEDLYVRDAFRRQGLGTFLLRTVAQQAAQRGLGRVEWSVLDWNVNAINFYEKMGAIVQQEWKICRLTGAALQAYK